MRIKKDDKGIRYLPYPHATYPQKSGFKIDPDFQSISRALGIETGFANYYQGSYGSFKMIRADLAKIIDSDPMLVFGFTNESDVRKYYQEHFGDDMDDWYIKHPMKNTAHKDNVITLQQYPAYVTIQGIQQELSLPDVVSTERLLKALHTQYGVPLLRSIKYYRNTNGNNRAVVYRKELAHLLLYPNIGEGIKVTLVEQSSDWESLVALAKKAGIYDLYPYDLENIPR